MVDKGERASGFGLRASGFGKKTATSRMSSEKRKSPFHPPDKAITLISLSLEGRGLG
jgi:hypothetical protein